MVKVQDEKSIMRKRIISKLEYVWDEKPMRFCQLIYNMLCDSKKCGVVSQVGLLIGIDPYYLEDKEFEEMLDKEIKEIKMRQ